MRRRVTVVRRIVPRRSPYEVSCSHRRDRWSPLGSAKLGLRRSRLGGEREGRSGGAQAPEAIHEGGEVGCFLDVSEQALGYN